MAGFQLSVRRSGQRDQRRAVDTTMRLSRRALLALGAGLSASELAPVRAADEKRAGNKLKVAIFFKAPSISRR
jgi:hypothetical protein